MKNPGSSKMIVYIFGGIGSLFLFLGIYFFVNAYRFTHSSETKETVGKVEDLVVVGKGTYAPVVTFTKADGTELRFTSNSSSNPPAYDVGESVTVLYKGYDYRIKSFSGLYLLPIVFSGFGVLFTSIGLSIPFFRWRRKKKIALLKSVGTVVHAKITEVFHDTSMHINGHSPWRIKAQKNEASSVSVFQSDSIWFDPTEFAQVGKEVTVYVNPSKKSEYYVDLSFLPTQN